MNLEDNFRKFWEKILTGVNRQDQNNFSPGGTHREQFGCIVQNLDFWKANMRPFNGKTSEECNFESSRDNFLQETQEGTYQCLLWISEKFFHWRSKNWIILTEGDTRYPE